MRLTRVAPVLLALSAWAVAWGQAAPGQVVALEHRGSVGAAEIDAEVAGRFRSDGEDPPRAITGVEAYLLRYATTGPDGGAAESIAQLYLPQTPLDDALLAFAPRSTGIDPACSPTRVWLATTRVETYGAYALAYAGQGLPTVLPDYLAAIGTTALQPYFVAMAEAAVVLDALRAARHAIREVTPSTEVAHAFVAGFSQGGHAAFAAADRVATYAVDVPLAGVVGFGPSGELDTLFRHFHYLAPWVVRAYQEVYPGAVAVEQVLAPRFAARLDQDARSMCVLEAQSWYPTDPTALYADAFFAALDGGTLARDYPAWRDLFDRNATGVQAHGLPVAVFQGVDDPVVPLAAQDAFVARLCDLGSPVRYANYLRTRHETRYVAFADALAWIRTIAAGLAPPDDCQEVHR